MLRPYAAGHRDRVFQPLARMCPVVNKGKSMSLNNRVSLLMAACLLAFGAFAAGHGRAQHPAAKPYKTFGMCSNGNILTNPEYPVKMLDAGARMCRMDVTFAAVRKQPGNDPATWDWSGMEKIAALHKQHPDLQPLVLLGYGANWADDPKFKNVPGGPNAAGQAGIETMPAWSPANLYGHYVYETVRRYKNVAHYWESWNEPDLPGHAFFKGNGADFLPYQKACYLAAKHADPHCTVLFSGLCFASVEGYLNLHHLAPPTPYPPTTCFFEEYLQACIKDSDARKNHFYFDIMNQHSYSRASDLYDYAQIDQKLMREYLHEEKPLWMTETGFEDRPGIFGGNGDEYCDYLLQAFAWSQLAGVERVFHFQLDNSNAAGLYQGMLGEPKPALTTYQDVLTKEFTGATFERQAHGNVGVGFLAGNSPFKPTWKQGYDLFAFRNKAGKPLWVAFADTDKAVDIMVPAVGKTATLIDRHNNRTRLTAQNGHFSLHLPGATLRNGWPIAPDPKAKALGEPEHGVGGATQILIDAGD